ncbi:6-phospho-3-hexuloisomerase [Rhodococcus koreensis]
MPFDQFPAIVLSELEKSLSQLDSASCDQAVEMIASADKVFVLGLGRLGLMLKSLAMRLMHMGREVYVVGETITPNYGPTDLLIIGSASGETKQLTQIAEKAKGLGGRVLALTGTPGSTITGIADVSVLIPAPSKNQSESGFTSAQPMASLFEQAVLLLGDSLVLALMARSTQDNDQMFTKHANLE